MAPFQAASPAGAALVQFAEKAASLDPGSHGAQEAVRAGLAVPPSAKRFGDIAPRSSRALWVELSAPLSRLYFAISLLYVNSSFQKTVSSVYNPHPFCLLSGAAWQRPGLGSYARGF